MFFFLDLYLCLRSGFVLWSHYFIKPEYDLVIIIITVIIIIYWETCPRRFIVNGYSLVQVGGL
jgi:hypothetical protein